MSDEQVQRVLRVMTIVTFGAAAVVAVTYLAGGTWPVTVPAAVVVAALAVVLVCIVGSQVAARRGQRGNPARLRWLLATQAALLVLVVIGPRYVLP